MSIPVDLAALDAQISQFGPSAILVTTSTDGPPHVSSVLVAREQECIAMRVGSRTRANAAARPAVALVWPPASDGDYCLIVDATAEEANPSSEMLVVRPTSAVLHRVAQAPATEGSGATASVRDQRP